MPAEMSAELKAIVEWIRSWPQTDYWPDTIASKIEEEAPPAPAERWPRCGCGGLLDHRTIHTTPHNYHVIECFECGNSAVGATSDDALAAFRAAEQEQSKDA